MNCLTVNIEFSTGRSLITRKHTGREASYIYISYMQVICLVAYQDTDASNKLLHLYSHRPSTKEKLD